MVAKRSQKILIKDLGFKNYRSVLFLQKELQKQREAYAKNPEFYAFYKALESLELIISKDVQVFLTTDNDILRLLKKEMNL